MSLSLTGWLLAFLLTLTVEVPVWWAALRGRVGDRRALGVALAVNTATHPTLWLAWALVRPGAGEYWRALVVAESLVVLTEGLLAFALGRRVPPALSLCTSLAANALSTAVGLLIGPG